jgi:hypothetical protein
LETVNRFGIVRLQEKKDARLVQVIQIVPQSNEMIEEHEEVELFRQQFAPGVYKIWPTEPLPAGEYAVMEYTPGEGNIRVWDFSCRPGTAGAAAGSNAPSTDPGKDP